MAFKYNFLILLVGFYGTYYVAGMDSYGSSGVQGAYTVQGNCGVSYHPCGYVSELRALPAPTPAPIVAPPVITAPAAPAPIWTKAPAAPTYTPSRNRKIIVLIGNSILHPIARMP